jgi:hypothetical protein
MADIKVLVEESSEVPREYEPLLKVILDVEEVFLFLVHSLLLL